ncbi:hypothetical protein FJZ39_02780 [Candidatus Saccharibacteria bacterium]|nr:hypothetical protein [Candidatus Saccharibacteria bacterium]
MKKRIWVIDFDRTIAEVDSIMAAFYDTLSAQNIVEPHKIRSQLDSAKQHIEASGGSFDVASFLDSTYSPQVTSALFELFSKSIPSNDIYTPGLHKFIKRLNEQGEDFVILSYGDTRWQAAKIRHARIAAPYLVTASPHKIDILASWIEKSGAVVLPHELMPKKRQYNEIILIDDKIIAFDGIEKYKGAIRGYHYVGAKSSKQTGRWEDYGPHVTKVQHFSEINFS